MTDTTKEKKMCVNHCDRIATHMFKLTTKIYGFNIGDYFFCDECIEYDVTEYKHEDTLEFCYCGNEDDCPGEYDCPNNEDDDRWERCPICLDGEFNRKGGLSLAGFEDNFDICRDCYSDFLSKI